MFFIHKDKTPAYLVGLCQAIVVIAYCSFVVMIMSLLNPVINRSGELLTGVIVLTLFVFSAILMAVTVFGAPFYLLLEKNVKKAVHIVAFTLLWLAIGFALVIGVIFVI